MSRGLRSAAAAGLLLFMFFLAGGAALRESAAVDEIAHVGAGLSYLQRRDLRLKAEHPPLAKAIAALPLALSGTRADYASPSWTLAADFFPAYMTQWVFGNAVLGRWNDWRSTILWARLPMLLGTLLLVGLSTGMPANSAAVGRLAVPARLRDDAGISGVRSARAY